MASRRSTVSVDWLSGLIGVGDAADGQVLDVRRLGAEDGDDLVGLALHVERLQVMGHRQQVDFRRQLHRRVAPVAVGEDAELAAVDEAVLSCSCTARMSWHAVAGPVGQASRRVGGVLSGSALSAEMTSTQSSADEVIEMHDVVVHRVRQDDQVADVLGVERALPVCSAFSTARTEAMRVHRGADAADALGERSRRRAGRGPAGSARCRATSGRTTRPWSTLPPSTSTVDAQVAFDAGDRIDGDAGHGDLPLKRGPCRRGSRLPAPGTS